jgi:hypothetical protein
MSVVFASWHGFAGCLQSCRNSAAILGGAYVAIERGEPPAQTLDCDLLVLSGWRPEYEAILARRRRPTVARWHSSLLQTELSDELDVLLDLLGDERFAAVAANDPALVAALERADVFHLPDVLDPAEHAGVVALELRGTNVSLFGEGRPRKSLVVQAAAFERVRAGATGWTLHLNGQTRSRPWYARWLRATGVPFVDHGFLERTDYLSLVAAMDAGLAASLSESYGLAAADHILLGVPVVTSPAVVSIAASATQAAEPGDVGSVAAALEQALGSDVAPLRSALLRDAAERAATARAALATILSRAG